MKKIFALIFILGVASAVTFSERMSEAFFDEYTNGGSTGVVATLFFVKSQKEGRSYYVFGARSFALIAVPSEIAAQGAGGVGVLGGTVSIGFYFDDIQKAIESGDQDAFNYLTNFDASANIFTAAYLDIIPWVDSNNNGRFDMNVAGDKIGTWIHPTQAITTNLNYAGVSSMPTVSCGTNCQLAKFGVGASTTAGEKIELACYFLPYANRAQTGTFQGVAVDMLTMKCDVALSGLQTPPTGMQSYGIASFFFAASVDTSALANDASDFAIGSMEYIWEPSVSITVNGSPESADVSTTKITSGNYEAFFSDHFQGPARREELLAEHTRAVDAWSKIASNDKREGEPFFFCFQTFGTTAFTDLLWDPTFKGTVGESPFPSADTAAHVYVMWLVTLAGLFMALF